MLTIEQPGQRLFTCLGDDAFPHPLPELGLCGPELFPVFADHERRFLLAFLFLVRVSAQFDTPRPLREHTQIPRREASLARRQRVVKNCGQKPCTVELRAGA